MRALFLGLLLLPAPSLAARPQESKRTTVRKALELVCTSQWGSGNTHLAPPPTAPPTSVVEILSLSCTSTLPTPHSVAVEATVVRYAGQPWVSEVEITDEVVTRSWTEASFGTTLPLSTITMLGSMEIREQVITFDVGATQPAGSYGFAIEEILTVF